MLPVMWVSMAAYGLEIFSPGEFIDIIASFYVCCKNVTTFRRDADKSFRTITIYLIGF